jgi:hypothetical protein
MAIRASFTDPDTGETSDEAHMIVHNPLLDERTKQITLRLTVYASKADYDAGKRPIHRYERVFPNAQYNALRTIIMNAVEPQLISNFFPGGTRVAD